MKNATDVTLIISSATNFVNYKDISADAKAKALSFVEAWQNKKYETALSEHEAKYKEQFDRVKLSLGDNREQSAKDTETRIKDYSTVSDPSLAAMYFQFGRYLLISSSQPVLSQALKQQTYKAYGILTEDNIRHGILNTLQILMWK